MSAETDALDAAALAATNQTVAANALKDATDILVTAYAATKATVDNDLNNVENTADLDKIMSSAVATALGFYVQTSNLATLNGQPLDTGLALLITTSPTVHTSLSYATVGTLRTPLDENDLPVADWLVTVKELGQFMFVTTTDEPDDDETCFTVVHPTSGLEIGQWLLEQPSHEWHDAHRSIERSQLREWMDDEYLRFQAHHI